MKKPLIILLLFMMLSSHASSTINTAHSIEYKNRSDENVIFEKVKTGVVTILGAGFGSGFVINDNGLILTNYHVIKDQNDMLRVRFYEGTVIKADIIESDPENDLAIIRVNMNALRNKPYIFKISKQPESYVGQRVIAIGNPIDFLVFDKTLTQGVISKIDPKILYHDVALNGGNSGGPLIDTNGNVIGVNTFICSGGGQPLGGSIYINNANQLIESASKKINAQPLPSNQIYPDIPQKPYKHSLMNTMFSSEKDLNNISSIWKTTPPYYYVKGKNYDIFIITPLLKYKAHLKSNPQLLEEIRKNLYNKNKSLRFDAAGDYEPAYLTILVSPKPRLTNGSKAKLCGLSILGGLGVGPMIILLPTWDVKCKDGFQSVSLKNKTKQNLLSFSEGKLPLDNYSCGKVLYKSGFRYNVTTQDIYYGVFLYDYKYFENKEDIYFEVLSSNGKQTDKIIIPEKIKNKILNDFKPYNEYIKITQAQPK